MKRTYTLSVLLLGVGLIKFSVDAKAATYSSGCVTNNNPGNCNTGSQYSLDVNAVNSSTVAFTFRNTAANSSSVMDLYFDQNYSLFNRLGLPSYSSGVLLLPGAKNMPGPVSFDTDMSFSKVGSSSWGINRSNEYATIRFGIEQQQNISGCSQCF